MKSINLSDYVSPTVLEAVEFDKTYFPVPIQESGEKLVNVRTIIENQKLKAVFNEAKTATGQERLFVLREGLVEPLLLAMKDLEKESLFPRFEYLYRRLEDQKASFERSVKTFIEKYPDLPKNNILEIAGVFVAANAATAAHVSGAAIDITLVDEHLNPVDLGAPYIHPGPESTTYFPDIPENAKKTRNTLCKIMEKHGFTNYPYEFWHFSLGDKIDARIHNKDHAIYGPVLYDDKTGMTKTINNSDARFNVDYLFSIN